MIEIHLDKGIIELGSFSSDATLGDLVQKVEEARNSGQLGIDCSGCGKCCYDPIPILGMDLPSFGLPNCKVPGVPLPEIRRREITGLMRDHKLNRDTASLLYEYNNGDPITPLRKENGSCIFLSDNLCNIYSQRPFACRFYNCAMGETLQCLYENIIRQGIWHSYISLGIISKNDIPENPFLKFSPELIPVRFFQFNFEDALGSLFSYF